ncbi:LysM peptidoglycan-binding domain-containing protein [Flavobacterium aestivum]|uniref:LysM peptidoglycan-binding domain-containing protein n=1 Tax=Flavobacterium aestivum TaxID=3003257 RepID=UPI0024824910|nr:peptidoglycan endopeptidase [Flavobacterium aestivum]
MKYFRVLVFVMTLCSVSVFSQDKNIKHSIAKGETISSIAEKYNVSASSIYKLNPKAKKTLQLNQVLLIPIADLKKTNKVAAIPEKTTAINHEVLPKETLYGIVKQYKTTTELLFKANPQLETEGLKIGQIINIPTTGLTKSEITSLSNKNTSEIDATAPLMHQVKPKESLYVIAKLYSVTIKELNEANPKIGKKGLSIGQMITIPSNGKVPNESVVVEEKAIQEISNATVAPENKTVEPNQKEKGKVQKEVIVAKEIERVTPNDAEPLMHKVKSKESLYVIAKQYSITLKELKEANPKIGKKGLSIGQMIVIPRNGKSPNELVVVDEKVIQETSNVTEVSEKKTVESNQKEKGKVQKEVVVTKEVETVAPNDAEPLMHKVKSKESLYVIAKQYSITLKELKEANPKIGKKGLSIGQMIVIPSKGKIGESIVVEEKAQEVTKEVAVSKNNESVPVVAESTIDAQNGGTDLIHEVLPKETKYGIAKKYGITVAVLEKQNPAIQQKLLVGSKLTIRVPNSTIGTVTKEEVVEVKDTESGSTISISNESLIDQLIASASDHIGTRYRSGGTSKAGFDCSGLMCSTFGGFDIKLPRSSIEQSSYGERIDVENAQKGDLIFFRTNGRSRINHVGMVVEVADGEIKFIHSSIHSGVIISSTKEPYYQRNFAQVNRVVK